MGFGSSSLIQYAFSPVGLAFSPNFKKSLSIYWDGFVEGISPWGTFLHYNYIYNSFWLFSPGKKKKKEGVSIFKGCLSAFYYINQFSRWSQRSLLLLHNSTFLTDIKSWLHFTL